MAHPILHNGGGSNGEHRASGGGTPDGTASPSAAARAKWADKRIFTTGEAAEVCKVSQQTIIRCFDSGRLGGFRVPGSKFRRIPRAELIKFMQNNEIPTEILEGPGKRVLVVDDDPAILELFTDLLSRDPRWDIKTACTGYDAGLLTESFRPHVVILDYMLPDINGNIVCQRLRANPEMKHTKVIIVSGVVNQAEIDQLLRSGADDFVKKPFNVQQIVDKMASLAGV
jgi:excisionase family DNA binding protein